VSDEPQVSEVELAALADGSLPAVKREQLRARVTASPELSAALAEQERAVAMMRGIDEPAPAALRARVDELVGAPPPVRRSRWGRTLFLPGATALAIVVAALVVALGSHAPTIGQTARVALAAATSPAPAEDPARPGLLALSVGGVAFPYYARGGWPATGSRTDRIDGRRVVTVFYGAGSRRVGYAIVSGSPLRVSGGRMVSAARVRYVLQRLGAVRLVTWRRGGHTCVIAGRGASQQALLALAEAEERGPAS
jgi:anti-sigma factor RsiW